MSNGDQNQSNASGVATPRRQIHGMIDAHAHHNSLNTWPLPWVYEWAFWVWYNEPPEWQTMDEESREKFEQLKRVEFYGKTMEEVKKYIVSLLGDDTKKMTTIDLYNRPIYKMTTIDLCNRLK
jgi:hypothetical protein